MSEEFKVFEGFEKKEPPQWMGDLSERDNAEIAFCKVYARDFAHGTIGHNSMLIIARLAKKLDEAEAAPNPLGCLGATADILSIFPKDADSLYHAEHSVQLRDDAREVLVNFVVQSRKDGTTTFEIQPLSRDDVGFDLIDYLDKK